MPAEQKLHTEPLDALKEPAGQIVHEVEPEVEPKPAVQLLHAPAVSWPVAFE